MSQTLNPKTGEWNKPKAGTYNVIAVMVRNPANGHVAIETLRSGGWDKEDKICSFEERRAAAIGEYETNAIKYIRATNRVNELVTVTIGRSDEPPQTKEERAEIYRKALNYAYAEQEGKV